MCGLFGFAGPQSFRAASLLQALAIADQVRGRHSTGLAVAAKREGSRRLSGRVSKKALSGIEFVRAGWTSLLFREKYSLAIGHNRYATAGEVNDRNAHPFAVPRSHGFALAAHNGIVGGKEAIAERFGVKNYPVDSEVYFRAISRRAAAGEKGLLDAIEEVTAFIAPRADFTCLWLEPAWRSLYFWRSKERPLSVFDARGLGLGRYLCSTVEIFSDAWGQIRGMLPSIKKVSCFEAKPYSIYRVVDDGTWEVERVRELVVPKGSIRREVSSRVPAQGTFGWGGLDPTSKEEGKGAELCCVGCGAGVSEEEAIFAHPESGVRTEHGSPHHSDCAPEPPTYVVGGVR